MRRGLPYLGIIAFYIAVIVIAHGWLKPVLMPARGISPAAHRWHQLQQQVAEEHNELRKLVLRDSVLKILPADRELFVVANDSTEEYLARVLDREVPGPYRAAVGVLGVPIRFGGSATLYFGRREFVMGTHEGLPYCATAMAIERRRSHILVNQITRSGLIGGCRWWAEYGAPGRHIAEWLERGGIRFGAYHDPATGWETLRENYRPGMLRFGQRPRWALPLRGQACLAGRTDVCAQAVLAPDTVNADPRDSEYAMESTRWLVFGEQRMFAALEQQFGKERFARFWMSHQPPEAAFQAAFGVELGDWLHQWMQPIGYLAAGARLEGGSIFMTLILLGMLAGGVVLTAQRRRI
jgi:hypothetical protein